jgi:RecA/RadA recombinase
MSKRPLSTIHLPTGTFPLLARRGYTTCGDLVSVSAPELAKGEADLVHRHKNRSELTPRELGVESNVAEAILHVARPKQTGLLTQVPPSTFQNWAGAIPSSSFVPSSNPASQMLLPDSSQIPHTQSASALLHGRTSVQNMAEDPNPPTSTPSVTADKTFDTMRLPFHNKPLDSLLDGGIPRGHILELSGPPQARKDRLALGAIQSAISRGETVWWVDTQNMTSPAAIKDFLSRKFTTYPLASALDNFTLGHDTQLPGNYLSLISYKSIQTLPRMLIFLENLLDVFSLRSVYTASQAPPRSTMAAPSSIPSSSVAPFPPLEIQGGDAKPSLLVISSISFPFQSETDMSVSTRTSVLDRFKAAFTRLCASSNLSARVISRILLAPLAENPFSQIVVTSNLAAKLVNADGTAGNFETGAKAILMPALGTHLILENEQPPELTTFAL